MIDFTVTECSKLMYIYCTLFYLLITLAFKRYSVISINSSRHLNPLFAFCVFVYIVTSFYNGDFWHYQDFVLNKGFSFWTPSEELYTHIASWVGNNYLLFRIVVWGTAFYLLVHLFKRFNLNLNSSLFYFFVIYISVFDYARASLAMAVYFLGFSYWVKPASGRRILSRVFGVIIMISSFFFHQSMIAVILITPIIYLPLRKNIVLILFIALPLISFLLGEVFTKVSGSSSISLELLTSKMNNYSELSVEIQRSFLEKIRIGWHYLTFFIPFLIATYKMIFKRMYKVLPTYISDLYKITLGVILLSVSCLFLGFNNVVLFYRFLYVSMIPLTILICYLYEQSFISSKTFRGLILFGFGNLMFRHSKLILKWGGPIK